MKTTDALAIIDHLYFNGKPHMTEALHKATTKLRQQIADPNNTTCPTCHAQPNQPCQTYHPNTGWTPATHKITHASRLIQAKKEAAQ